MRIYKSQKRGCQIDLCAGSTWGKKSFIYILNILPVIEYMNDSINDDVGDHCSSITFSWIVWQISLWFYWGEAYRGH